jgi:hypothetical protein
MLRERCSENGRDSTRLCRSRHRPSERRINGSFKLRGGRFAGIFAAWRHLRNDDRSGIPGGGTALLNLISDCRRIFRRVGIKHHNDRLPREVFYDQPKLFDRQRLAEYSHRPTTPLLDIGDALDDCNRSRGFESLWHAV